MKKYLTSYKILPIPLLVLFTIVHISAQTPQHKTLPSQLTYFDSIECPPGGLDEGEGVCPDEYIDYYNGGCQSDPVAFLPIEHGDIYCGMINTYTFNGTNLRDTDWYRLDITDKTSNCHIIWEGICEMPYMIFLVNALEEDCIDYEILTYFSGEPLETFSINQIVEPGIYWLAIMASVFEGYPEGQDYVMLCLVEDATTPINDLCSNALPIGIVNDLPFSTVNATTDGYSNSCGGNESCIDIWYAYSPEYEGNVIFSLCGSSFDTRLALWDGCGGEELICNDNACGQQSELVYHVFPGATYYIQIGGHNSETGEGILNMYPMFELYPLTGHLTYFGNNIPLEEVLIDAGNDSGYTDENGYYGELYVPRGDLSLFCTHTKPWQSPDIIDAFILLQYLATGLPELTYIQRMAGDVTDGTGEGLNVIDALYIRYYVATGYKPSPWQSPDWLYYDTEISIEGPTVHDFKAIMSGDVNGSNTPD